MNAEFSYPGYEDMEISTQLLMKEADSRSIQWEILDRPENFLLLRKGSHIEYIKQASKTRLDSYITYLMMENKTVSKYAMEKAGLKVPKGKSFHTRAEAYKFYSDFFNLKKVIKPVTTNFGIGIQISDPDESEIEFRTKIDRAFKYSNSVIIEEFIVGPEYRFLVLGGKTVAVCNRVPANVIGDGESTISELVDKKNEDPRRGTGHVTPLEKIQKNEIETENLKKIGLDWNSIPKSGETIYLRTNSNISTGGDSIDRTDSVHPDFKTIAERAAESVQAAICGVDIISNSIESSPTPENHAILEINFNPVLYIHEFPYQGENRKVTGKILDLLGF